MIRFAVSFVVILIAALPARAATDIIEVTSPGGIKAWLVQETSIPMVALQMSFRGGSAIDPVGKEGATNLMMGLLEEGSGEMDAVAFLTATEEIAARYSWDAYRDSVSIDAEMLTSNLDASVALLRQAIMTPTFDDVAFERVKSQVISSLQSDSTDPNQIAGTKLRSISFPGHPYAVGTDGTIESVSALTRDDMVDAHQRALVRSRAIVSAVGDITPEELGRVLDTLLGDLPEDGPPLPPKTTMAVGGGITVVELDTPQSVAIFGHEGMPREDPDYLAAYVLNEIMGGSGLESRLMREVREKRGLTYGVYSYLAPFDAAAQYLGNVASANDRVAQAIDVVRDEWRKMAETGITQEELDAAKTYLTGAYPLRFDSNVKIAGILVGLQIVGLPIDYVKTRNDQINAITLDDMNRVAARLFNPEALHVVVVGKPEGLDAD